MIITCEECGTRFNLNEELIKPQGSKVRCSKCRAVFVAHPPIHPGVTPAADADAKIEGMSGTGLQAEGIEEQPSPSVEATALFASPGLGEDDLRFGASDQQPSSPADDSAEVDLETPEGLDLSDLDQMFTDEEETAGMEAGADVEEPVEELDLSELEQLLESEEAPDKVEDVAEAFEDLDLGLGDADSGEELVSEATGGELTEGTEELDLSDLEQLIEAEEAPAEVKDAAAGLEDLELDLGDMSAAEEPAADAAGEALAEGTEELDLSELEKVLESGEAPIEVEDAAEALEDLDLDLDDTDLGAEPVVETADGELAEGTEEFDLSELEKLLDSDDTPAGAADAAAGLEDLELDLGDALAGETETIGAEAESEEKLDLSEIEKMLDTEGESADMLEETVELEDLELDLDLPDVSMKEKIEEGETASAEVDDFELADLEDIFETKAQEGQEDTFETEDLDLDFEIEDFDQTKTVDSTADLSQEAQEAEPREEIFAVADQAMPDMEAPAEDESEPVAAMAAASPMIARKKRMGAPLWVLLILLILGGGAFGTYTVLNRMGIEVPFARQLANLDIELPFIGRLMKPKVEDPGNLKIKTDEITSRFVTNTQHGKLFVISGLVKNEYPESRDAISITGKLYTKGKVEIRNEIVFCGNVLSDKELADLGLEAIMQRLAKPFGGGDANRAVKPGASLPFMVVFGNLPDDLEEFTLEVAGSSAAQ